MNTYFLEFDDERSGGFASCEIGNKLTEEEQWAKLKLVKEIADLSAEVMSPRQIRELSNHIHNWENISFEDRRKVVDGLITQIRATSEYVQIEWKI